MVLAGCGGLRACVAAVAACGLAAAALALPLLFSGGGRRWEDGVASSSKRRSCGCASWVPVGSVGRIWLGVVRSGARWRGPGPSDSGSARSGHRWCWLALIRRGWVRSGGRLGLSVAAARFASSRLFLFLVQHEFGCSWGPGSSVVVLFCSE